MARSEKNSWTYLRELRLEASKERREWMKNYSRALYASRKNKGLCTQCGENAIAGQVLCERCRYVNNLKRRKNEDGAQKRPRRVFTEPRDKNREKAEYMKARREEFRQQGLCTNCGKEKALPGLKFCGKCRMYRNQKRCGYVEHTQEWFKKERLAGRL